MKRLMKKGAILETINKYVYDGKLPRNINYNYNYGSMLGIILMIQIITGIYLASHYVGTAELAFESIEYIMREVPGGWIIRYTHANTAGIFFIIVYMHISRGLMYGSYTRRGVWTVGVIILITMIITAFIGYSLVYGQMSYWAIAVITNILTVIPYVGKEIVQYIYGGYNIGTATITRFYALHYILPIIIGVLALVHLVILHRKGGTNPIGIKGKRINFHPYYTIKDGVTLIILIIGIIGLVTYAPNVQGHTDNYIEGNALVTPAHISPEYYLLYYYMGLRSIPNKVLGVVVMGGIILLLLTIPYGHKGIISTVKLRPIYSIVLKGFYINFILGTYIGGVEAVEPYITIGRLSVLYYILFFVVIVPIVSLVETGLFVIMQRERRG